MAEAIISPTHALLLTGLGAIGLLVAGFGASVAALGAWGQTPGRRAILQWLPIAAAVGVALYLKQSDAALGIIFGTSVAFLSTAMGAVSTIAPVGPAPARWKRLWPFTLVAALIVFLSGFNGLLTWKHGLALVLEGLALWPLWRDDLADHEWSPPRDPTPLLNVDATIAWIAILISVAVAIAAAIGAFLGAEAMTHLRVRVSGGAIAASLLSLMLVSPTIQGSRRIAALGASWLPVTANVGVVLLNLCILLPIVAFLPYAFALKESIVTYQTLKAAAPSVHFAFLPAEAVIFPIAIWRVDATVLVILSVIFLPVAMGKWNMGKEEGAILIIAYCFYLMAVMASGI